MRCEYCDVGAPSWVVLPCPRWVAHCYKPLYGKCYQHTHCRCWNKQYIYTGLQNSEERTHVTLSWKSMFLNRKSTFVRQIFYLANFLFCHNCVIICRYMSRSTTFVTWVLSSEFCRGYGAERCEYCDAGALSRVVLPCQRRVDTATNLSVVSATNPHTADAETHSTYTI